ncbi:segregation and condensation protein A [Caldithrix abyssi]|uniref:Segregation and condensation protein A n=1 Tax=Caldithrix abyssi DSM 13497 TaxID=880073 RepID=H1XYC1_CALAY|nr:segregation/condensation protein A [Caldithrix abyssi]APF19282.1 condensin subunit ScpA [Caldithrix abyssi DSM 13497]EHO43188.1 Segregation and condensation protein A [Caldithrix abyssi DSM 13497]
MRYRVKLDIFEGPFDLLLFLIRKNEVDIYDIPIAQITEQFLEYIEAMRILDLNVAGDFIEMVAILMHIKARMLLPKMVTDGEEEPDDPRTELVERLLEYKRFKEAAFEFKNLEEERKKYFTRRDFKFIERESREPTTEEFLEKVTLFDLMIALKRALDNMPKITYHQVERIDVTVEQQSEFLLNELKEKKMILFQDLMKQFKEKIVLIVTFIALLELIRKGQIEVRQSEVFDDIRIKLKKAA